MINLDPAYLDTIYSILDRFFPEADIYVFGSRATGRERRYSDLDLLLDTGQRIDWRRLESLKDAFSESNLPFFVDVVDRNAISRSFLESIESTLENITVRTPRVAK